MKTAPYTANEKYRLKVLERYGLLDTPPEAAFDNITKAAASLCEAPIALISLVDSSRQWFKSRVGLNVTETSRNLAFCAHAILQPEHLMEVEDTLLDDRFFDNPLVTDDPNIRFYAGKPLVTLSGHPLGTLCIIDLKPRKLTLTQRQTLSHLADAVVSFMEEWHQSKISAISRTIEHNLVAGIVLTDANKQDNPITYCNQQFEQLTGFSQKEIIGKNCRFLQGTGSDPIAIATVRDAIVNATACTVVLKNYRKNGTEFWNELTISPVHNSLGQLIHFLGMQQDVTERVRLEFESLALSRELAHMGRVTTMGEMATGLAHELNQPLTAIVQNTDAALSVVKSNHQNNGALEELLLDIDTEAQRASDIIRALRQFISKDHGSRTSFELNELIKQTIKLIATETRTNNIDIELTTDGVTAVVANRVQIAQVLVNLLRNSLEAIVAADASVRKICITQYTQDNMVIVNIEDSGPGLATDLIQLKPFDSAKKDGMGMGLTICRSLIESHGGKLWSNTSGSMGGATISFSISANSKSI